MSVWREVKIFNPGTTDWFDCPGSNSYNSHQSEKNIPWWKRKCIMALKIERVETWAASLKDKPGDLAAKLGALASAGVNLEFVIARRAPDKPGTGVIFVTPIKGSAGLRAAREAGFEMTVSLHTVRIAGADKKGQGARIAQALAEKGLNLRGLSAAAIGGKFVAHIALDSSADATKAVRVLQGL